MPRGYPKNKKQLSKYELEKINEKRTRLYRIWYGMNYRCKNESSPSYYLYGSRGIGVLWKSFESFKNDMYDSYIKHVERFGEKETTIDRIDSGGNYCKENCRWATRYEQTQNRNENYYHRGNRSDRWCFRKL